MSARFKLLDGLAYSLLAVAGPVIVVLCVAFALAGVGIGCAETAEHAAVAAFAPQGDSRLGVRSTGNGADNRQSRGQRDRGALVHRRITESCIRLPGGWMLIALATLTSAARTVSR
jgi:hypothetical protein